MPVDSLQDMRDLVNQHVRQNEGRRPQDQIADPSIEELRQHPDDTNAVLHVTS
jgi:hypothetical protein